VLRRALELGITLIDTADSYGPFVSERLIAEALHPYPENLLIATKAGFQRSGPDQWEPDGRPEYLRERCESSLVRRGFRPLNKPAEGASAMSVRSTSRPIIPMARARKSSAARFAISRNGIQRPQGGPFLLGGL
jgi:hypothetical protein